MSIIQPKYMNLNELFNSRVFTIPAYQRFYSWEHKQRKDFFDDIEDLKRRDANEHHFMATIVCYNTNDVKNVGYKQYNVFDIVDGQQRLTTLVILLKCIHLKLSDENARSEIGNILVKNDGNLILLQTNNVNSQLFNNFIKYGQKPKHSDITTIADKNLYNAVDDCMKYVDSWEDINELISIINYRLGFVVYDTSNSRVVYSIFEVLNSRGLTVDWLDKCKSMIMASAYDSSPTEERQVFVINSLNDLWGNIYREIATENIPGHEIIRITSTLHLTESSSKPFTSQDALDRIKLYCVEGKNIDAPEKVSNWIFDITKKLVYLQGNKYLGPVTSILHSRILAIAIQSADVLTDDEKQKCIRQLENISFRIFGLFGKDSRTKIGEYIRLAVKIMNRNTGASRFSEIIQSLKELGSDYPIEEAVEYGLNNKNFYENNEEICRYLLWKYEEYLERSASGSGINAETRAKIWQERSAQQSIEHIFPQNPELGGAWDGKLIENDNVNRIGNLILLPIDLNAEARRQGFNSKKNVYSKCQLRMINEITSLNDWSSAEIAEREKGIIDWAKIEWADISF